MYQRGGTCKGCDIGREWMIFAGQGLDLVLVFFCEGGSEEGIRMIYVQSWSSGLNGPHDVSVGVGVVFECCRKPSSCALPSEPCLFYSPHCPS